MFHYKIALLRYIFPSLGRIKWYQIFSVTFLSFPRCYFLLFKPDLKVLAIVTNMFCFPLVLTILHISGCFTYKTVFDIIIISIGTLLWKGRWDIINCESKTILWFLILSSKLPTMLVAFLKVPPCSRLNHQVAQWFPPPLPLSMGGTCYCKGPHSRESWDYVLWQRWRDFADTIKLPNQ